MTCPFAKFAALLPVSSTDGKHSYHALHPHPTSLPTHPLTLSDALRLGTAKSHRAVEKSRGVHLLLQSVSSPGGGVLNFDRIDYVRFNIMLACIYTALEAAMYDARTSPLLAPLFGDAGLVETLARTGALMEDIKAHLETVQAHTGANLSDLAEQAREECGASTSSVTAEDVEDPSLRLRLMQMVQQSTTSALLFGCEDPTAPMINEDHIALLKPAQVRSTLNYVHSLLTLSGPRSELLLAHAYTRYLGDLSGGQHIVRKVSKRFPTDPPGRGFSFYSFNEVAGDLKARFRLAMEQSVTPEKAEAVQGLVSEANTAFELNTGVFESLLPAELRMEKDEKVEVGEKVEREQGRVERVVLVLLLAGVAAYMTYGVVVRASRIIFA